MLVRSHLLFSSVIWGSQAAKGWMSKEIKEAEVMYRSSLRTMMNVGRRVRNEILYIVAARLPLDLIIMKGVYRYYKKIGEQADMEDYERLITRVLHWLR